MREVAHAHSLNGVAYATVARITPHAAGIREVTRAWNDGVEYVGWPHCHANNFTCTAPKAKSTNYCIGHLRAAAKQQTEERELVKAAESEQG